MTNLQDLINLAKADGGKFFVVDEKGDMKLVIMSVEDYQRLLLGKLQKQIVDVENINQQILKAQLQEPEVIVPEVEKPKPQVLSPQVRQSSQILRQDLRAEVIDPSFDFEMPKGETDDF